MYVILLLSIDGQTIVYNFRFKRNAINNYILKLYVPMNDVELLERLQVFDDVSHD
jgi:hypothetical protein